MNPEKCTFINLIILCKYIDFILKWVYNSDVKMNPKRYTYSDGIDCEYEKTTYVPPEHKLFFLLNS